MLLHHPRTDINYRDKQGQTALFKAARHGHDHVVRLLLDIEGIDVNIATEEGFTPLIQAMFDHHKQGHQNVIRLLLARPELDVNTIERTYHQNALWMATGKDTDMLRELLRRKDVLIDARARYGETPLGRACRQSFNNSLPLLLAAGADVNLKDKNGSSPLIHAATEGNESALELLFDHKAVLIDDADPKGETALIKAAKGGHTKCVKLLIAQDSPLEHKDSDGKTALNAAATLGYKIVVKLLLKAKANINSQDKNGNTALALATMGKHEAVVRLLLER